MHVALFLPFQKQSLIVTSLITIQCWVLPNLDYGDRQLGNDLNTIRLMRVLIWTSLYSTNHILYQAGQKETPFQWSLLDLLILRDSVPEHWLMETFLRWNSFPISIGVNSSEWDGERELDLCSNFKLPASNLACASFVVFSLCFQPEDSLKSYERRDKFL